MHKIHAKRGRSNLVQAAVGIALQVDARHHTRGDAEIVAAGRVSVGEVKAKAKGNERTKRKGKKTSYKSMKVAEKRRKKGK